MFGRDLPIAPDERAQRPHLGPALLGNEAVDAIDRLQRHPPTLLETIDEFAVIHREPAERGLRDAQAAARLVDLGEEDLAYRPFSLSLPPPLSDPWHSA
jgi:hypothetical protein